MFKSAIIILAAAASIVSAFDYRVLVQKPDCMTMQNFEVAWKGLCPNLPDAKAQNLTFGQAIFYPGDWAGNQADRLAVVDCTWTNQQGSTVVFTKEVLQILGGTTP